MMSIFFLVLLILPHINGKFLFDSGSSSIIVIRHIRLNTDNEHHRIRCPYHLKHLTLTLLNYSNNHCFDLYTDSINDFCRNYRSPCQFHAKAVRLDCHDRTDSNHVDVTYQCSYSPPTWTNTTASNDEEVLLSSTSSFEPITLHALSFPSTRFGIDETLGVFLIGLAAVFILWFTVCCVWLTRCDHPRHKDDGKCELLSIRPCEKATLMDFSLLSEQRPTIVGNLSGHTSTGGIENLCLHVNPFDNKRIASLKLTQID